MCDYLPEYSIRAENTKTRQAAIQTSMALTYDTRGSRSDMLDA